MINKIAMCAAVFVVAALVVGLVILGGFWANGVEIERGMSIGAAYYFGVMAGCVASAMLAIHLFMDRK